MTPRELQHRHRNVRRVGLLMLMAYACDFDDPEAEVEVNGKPLPATAATSAVNAASARKPDPTGPAPVPSDAPPSLRACPERMLEVRGSYCTDLMHHCIKGGRTHTGEDTEDSEPFYCDVYQTGYAKCVGKEEPKRFCVDEFEYPNQPGAIPMVMVSWYEARRLCEVTGKRLCGDDEWTLACEGSARLPYAYGWARDRTACNIDHRWIRPNDGLLGSKTAPPAKIEDEVERLSKRVPSGSMPRCRSPYGVMDMGGNVDEWAANVTLHGKPYQSVFKGGHWVGGARNRCRPITASHDENTAYYAEGFRCCASMVESTAK